MEELTYMTFVGGISENHPSAMSGKCKTKKSGDFWATKIQRIFAETWRLF